MTRRLAAVRLAFVTLAACVGTDNLTGGASSGSSGSSGSPEPGADVLLEPASLELADASCGQQARKSFAIINRSKNDVDYKVRSIDDALTFGGKAAGTLAPGAATTVDVLVTPQSAQAIRGTLIVEINGNSRPYPVTVRGRGATMSFAQTSVDFGDVRKQNGAETKIVVKNTGDQPLDTSLEAVAPTADFEISPTRVQAAPDGTSEVTVKMKAGASTPTPLTASFKATTTKGICGSPPVLEVRGKRVTTDVTVDVVDWGDVLCKTTPADRNAIIKNYGPSPVTYTATVSGTGIAITSGAAATVAGGSETNPSTQVVGLKLTPGTTPGQKDETLSITYAGQTSSGKVRAFVAGLVLVISPPSAALSSDGTTETRKTFNITNSAGKFGGYASFNASYQVTGPGFRAENGTGTYQPAYLVFPPTTGSVDVVFKAQGAGPVSGNLVVAGPVCSQSAVTLTGTNP